MKKLLSLVLALAMVLTATAAFAEGQVNVNPDKDTGDVHLDYNVGGNGPSVGANNTYVITVTTIITDSHTETETTTGDTTTTTSGDTTTTTSGDTTTTTTGDTTTTTTGDTTTSGDTISYSDAYNDKSDHSDNSNKSINDSYNTTTTETTTNTESGNSSASASASASAAAGDAGSSKKSSGASGSGSSSADSGKGASSSASSSAKAVAVSKSSGSGSGSGSSTVVAPSIQLVVVPDTAETTALKNSFAEAIKAGDPKTALPENISSKLSADLKSVNEFVTAKLVGDITGIASATVNVQFPTKYAAGDKVVVLFGIPNGNTTQWINVNGIIESDGSISMILTSTVLQALSGKTFALAVLSK